MYCVRAAFNALTLLVGWQEGHPACRKLSDVPLSPQIRLWLTIMRVYRLYLLAYELLVFSLFHDLLSRSYVYHSVWSVTMVDNFTPAKHRESFSAMFIEP